MRWLARRFCSRDLQLVGVLTQVAAAICASWAVAASYWERARSSESESCCSWPMHLLCLGALRPDRRVRKRRNCGYQSASRSRENVRRLSQPTNDNPLLGGGTGAPGGAGTSRVGQASSVAGRRQPRTCPKLAAILHEMCASSSNTVVRSRPVLGQAHTPQRRLFPFVAHRPGDLGRPGRRRRRVLPVAGVAARAGRRGSRRGPRLDALASTRSTSGCRRRTRA